MTLDYDTIRGMIETRWKRHGYENLLPEERDYILVWWLQAEASNGSLHQYFDNSTGDRALDTLDALSRINAPNAAAVFSASIGTISAGDYPRDRLKRQAVLASISNCYDVFGALTDRLFEESEDVTSLAIERVGDAYAREGITEDEATATNSMRLIAAVILLLIGVTVTILVVATLVAW
jgi:hypothetical protein